jgi:hypothetical protein
MRPAEGGRWCVGAVVLFAGLIMIRETRAPGEARHSRWSPLHHAARAAAASLEPRSRAEPTAILAAEHGGRRLG